MALVRILNGPASSGFGQSLFARYSWLVPASSQARAELVLTPYGATMVSAFAALVPRRRGGHTVLTGVLDRSALYGVLAEIDALGLNLLEVRRQTPQRESPAPGEGCSS